MTQTTRQTWTMWAGQRVNHGETEPVFCDLGYDPRYPRMHGHAEPVEVTVVEDPDGPYWGWLANTNRDRDADPTYEPFPSMIHEHEGLFRMCFPYGPTIEQDHNAGRILRLAVHSLLDTMDISD